MNVNTKLPKTQQERRETLEGLIEFIEIMGRKFKKPFPVEEFITAPASTKYHGNYEGGLIDHSITVTNALSDLTNKLNLKWERTESTIVVGIFHDLCKIDNYIATPKGKNPYKMNENNVIDGHGEKSIIYLQEYIDLTEEEMLCIRWHMGAYETDTNKWNVLGRAIEKYPNVLYTHTADMIASKIVGV